jgi:hypothetical protein
MCGYGARDKACPAKVDTGLRFGHAINQERVQQKWMPVLRFGHAMNYGSVVNVNRWNAQTNARNGQVRR